MHPSKVDRDNLHKLTDLPNIGKAGAEDLRVLGIEKTDQLVGMCPLQMYEQLCEKTSMRHDPCVIDVFLSITRFMDGEDAKPWWHYTAERKHLLQHEA